VRSRVAAVLVAAAVAAPSAVAASRTWCRLTDRFLAASCCDEDLPAPEPSISPLDCCERITTHLARATPQPPSDPMPGIGYACVIVPGDRTPVFSARIALATSQPLPGTSIRLRQVSLLL